MGRQEIISIISSADAVFMVPRYWAERIKLLVDLLKAA
jgi:hypothetical protein